MAVNAGSNFRPARVQAWGDVATLVAVLLAVVLPVALLWFVTPRSASDPVAVTLQYLVVLYASIRLAIICQRADRDWFSIVLFGYAYTWLGIAPLLHLIVGRNPLKLAVISDISKSASLIVLLGMAAYLATQSKKHFSRCR